MGEPLPPILCVVSKYREQYTSYKPYAGVPVPPAIDIDINELLVFCQIMNASPSTHNYVAVSLSLSIDLIHIHASNVLLCL